MYSPLPKDRLFYNDVYHEISTIFFFKVNETSLWRLKGNNMRYFAYRPAVSLSSIAGDSIESWSFQKQINAYFLVQRTSLRCQAR